MSVEESDNSGEFVRFLSQHVVVGIFFYETVERDGRVSSLNTFVLSGWLLEMDGGLFWVTAGHSLEKIDKPITKGQIRLVRTVLMDNLGWKAKHNNEVYIHYEPGAAFYIWEPEAGFDFAILPLRKFYRDQILANDNVPISRANWVHQGGLDFELFKMIGVPDDRVFRTPRPGDFDKIAIQPTLMAVHKMTYEEVLTEKLKKFPETDEWFVGRLDLGTGSQIVEGMSGGPIYGFRRTDEGQWSYHVVALQSWWDPDQRIIFGCSMPYFGEWLHRRFAELRASMEDEGIDYEW